MQTHDVDSITNSVMMEMEKVFRKNGIAGTTHRHYDANRKLLRERVSVMLAEHSNAAGTNPDLNDNWLANR